MDGPFQGLKPRAKGSEVTGSACTKVVSEDVYGTPPGWKVAQCGLTVRVLPREIRQPEACSQMRVHLTWLSLTGLWVFSSLVKQRVIELWAIYRHHLWENW